MKYFELEPEELEVVAPATAKEIISFKKAEDARKERDAKKRLDREERQKARQSEKEAQKAALPKTTKKSSSQQTSLFQF